MARGRARHEPAALGGTTGPLRLSRGIQFLEAQLWNVPAIARLEAWRRSVRTRTYVRVVHSAAIRDEIRSLATRGVSDSEIARRTGVPRTTVRDIRRQPTPRFASSELRPRCWRPARNMWFEPGDYAEILGLYLGDGYIARLPRTWWPANRAGSAVHNDERRDRRAPETAASSGTELRCDS